jgi:hypothetical protein
MERDEKSGKRKSATTKTKGADSSSANANRIDMVALKKQITRLEAENRRLRNQIAALTDTMNRSSESGSDAVREQRHNFFKYGNVRRH